MAPIPELKHLGLLSFLVLCIGLAYLVYKWPQGRHSTFSKHAAAQPKTIIYYIVLFATALPLLTIFYVGWFKPTFQLPALFLISVILSEILQHIVTIIPEIGGWKTKWHGTLTGASALLLLPALFFLALSPRSTSLDRTITILSLAIMLCIVAYQALIVDKRNSRNQMIFQCGYYGAFFMAILFATYTN